MNYLAILKKQYPYLGAMVAVKKLRVQKVHRRRLQQFEEEVSLFFKLNHPNIIMYVQCA